MMWVKTVVQARVNSTTHVLGPGTSTGGNNASPYHSILSASLKVYMSAICAKVSTFCVKALGRDSSGMAMLVSQAR